MLTDQQKAFSRVLDLLEEANCLSHVVLIRSWAEYAYKEANLLPGFNPNIRTLDVDFLVRNLRRPNPPVSLTSLAQERGFIVQRDSMLGTTRFLDISGLEVEFLINKMGAGLEPTLKTNVGVTAQTLRHMEILSDNSIELQCLEHLIKAPMPEAYAIHKMLINNQRGAKSEKDVGAIPGIWNYLDKGKIETVLSKLSRKELSRVNTFMATHNLNIS